MNGGGLSSHGDFVQRSWTSGGLANDPSTNLLETRAACESVMALSGPGDHVMLHIDNRIAAAYIRCQGVVQGVMCYLRKLFFSGSRLCQGMFLSFLLSDFLQEGTQQRTSFQGSIWLSGYPCWTGGCSSPFWIFSVFNQVVPVLGIVVEAMAHI